MKNEIKKSCIDKRFGEEEIRVIYRDANPLTDPEGKYPGFTPGKTCIENGILKEYDVPVTLRDGTIIYTDIYRPEGKENIPALICWGPYGKRSGYWSDTFFPAFHLLPEGSVSDMARFEGLDPAYWCPRGYAVVNPDPRGIGMSEGDLPRFSKQEGKDCADLIEAVAAYDWCSGKISMGGTSWLAIVQYFAAAEQPEHLTCIAPWEGHFFDYYRDGMVQGGIPTHADEFFTSHFWGKGRIEDIPAMVDECPLVNGYWEEKTADLSKIHIPVYIAGAETGQMESFRLIPSENKWYRLHYTNEWVDLYNKESLSDLERFYDHYLKGIDNGWEETPRVRMEIRNPGEHSSAIRKEPDWPISRTEYTALYLDANNGAMSLQKPAKESQAAYCADDGKGQAVFTYRFDKDTELSGFMKLRLWAEAAGSDDMDVLVSLEHLDSQGNLLAEPGVPCVSGQLRASHREIDPEKSLPAQPYYTHRSEQLLSEGEILPIEIPLSPDCVHYNKGESIRIKICGFRQPLPAMAPPGMSEEPQLRNRGMHIIHTGGKYDSYLLVPVIPSKS